MSTVEKKDKKKPKPKREILEPGTTIPSEEHRYVVTELLGSGGFGDVYKVVKENGDPNVIFALKTEDNKCEERLRRLKMEAEVLGECAKAKRTHFIGLIDRGRTEQFKFIVMPVVGATLDGVRSELPNKQFTKNTAHKICVQLLEALRDLHRMGYLHRDLKPSNFAIGLSDADRSTIFMLDFGIARKFLDKDGKIVIPRCKVAFMGTPRFAPRVAHRLQEQARKDDLESLCFVMTDIFNESALPWRGQREKMIVLQLKENFMQERGPIVAEILAKLPKELGRCIRYVEKLSYELAPSYDFMINEMRSPVRFCKEPLDWIDPNAPVNTIPIPCRATAYATRIVEPTVTLRLSSEAVETAIAKNSNETARSNETAQAVTSQGHVKSRMARSSSNTRKQKKEQSKETGKLFPSPKVSREPQPALSMEEIRDMPGSRAAALLKTIRRTSPSATPKAASPNAAATPKRSKSPNEEEKKSEED